MHTSHWNPAPTRGDTRALGLPAISHRKRNGPPTPLADRHARSRLDLEVPPVMVKAAIPTPSCANEATIPTDRITPKQQAMQRATKLRPEPREIYAVRHQNGGVPRRSEVKASGHPHPQLRVRFRRAHSPWQPCQEFGYRV